MSALKSPDSTLTINFVSGSNTTVALTLLDEMYDGKIIAELKRILKD